MSKKITVSAPGKLMLLGEHAVVYNRPCLVTAIDQRMNITMQTTTSFKLELAAPDVNVMHYKKHIKNLGQGEIPKGARFVEITIKNIFQKYSINSGIKITTQNEFSTQFGFGSSSAITVCVVKALSELFTLHLSQREIFDICYTTVLEIQGKGSGFDIAAAVYGGTLYFVNGGTKIESLKTTPLPLIVGYSGVKADTTTLINHVATIVEKNPKITNQLFTDIEIIVEKAKTAIIESDWLAVGNLMNENQKMLNKLDVSTKKLNEIIVGARRAGAYGAKLSGAGGGDCMIAVLANKKRDFVQKEITKKGGVIMHVKFGADGVKTHKNN